LLFDALTEFMKKSALKDAHEIVGYYEKKYKKVVKSYNSNKGAHVVGHYADGARLIGLTEKQLVRQLKKLTKCQNFKNKGDKNSPYAQPLQLSFLRSMTTKFPEKPKKRKAQKVPLPPVPPNATPMRQQITPIGVKRSHSDHTGMPPPPLTAPRKRKILLKVVGLVGWLSKAGSKSSKEDDKQENKNKKTKLRHGFEIKRHKPGWLSQRTVVTNVSINMPMKYREATVDMLPDLRKKVEEMKGKFDKSVAQKKIDSNIRHYKELDSRRVQSATLYRSFKRAFSAYSSAHTSNATALSVKKLKKASLTKSEHSDIQKNAFAFSKSHAKARRPPIFVDGGTIKKIG